MKRRVFRVVSGTIGVLVLGAIIFAFINQPVNRGVARVLSANFIGYDFARAVMGNQSEISMLLKPGTDIHSYEPTPGDIINIKNADLFIYVGGESDQWIEELLEDNEIPTEKTLRLMDLVEVKEESSEGIERYKSSHDEGIEKSETGHHHDEDAAEAGVEYDEHIWTSPVNAIKLVDGIKDSLSTIHPENKNIYNQNAESYIARLSDIDQQIRNIVNHTSKRELIFGDRFPFRYFVDEYGLSYYAAFPGCAEQTEASSQTIALLIDEARTNGVKVILKTESTSDKLAKTIAREVGAEVMTLNAMHAISEEDLASGITYVDVMEDNIEVLREALK